jgi:hypothetical protein
MSSEIPQSYRIRYDVHCSLENFFGKEIIVKRCYSEVHAKLKLGEYCEKKYGKEFQYIKFISVTKDTFEGLFGEIFGDNIISDLFGDKNYKDDYFGDILRDLKNRKNKAF